MKRFLGFAMFFITTAVMQATAAADTNASPAIATAKASTSSSSVRAADAPKAKHDGPMPIAKLEARAQAEARRWRTTGLASPLLGDDGVVLYPFGAYMPKMQCTILRTCIIDLEPGELLNPNGVRTGDKVRWKFSVVSSGVGASTQWHILVKPVFPNIETNLVVMTDRRVYDIALQAVEVDDYIHRMAFYYPQDIVEGLDAAIAQQQKKEEAVVGRIVDPTKLNFAYEWESNRYAKYQPLAPVRVFDDGQQTWIQMNPKVRSYEAPALMVKSATGDWEIVNYLFTGDYYKVDRLFREAKLVIGNGRKEAVVTIAARSR